MLAEIAGETVIARTYRSAHTSGLFDAVYVVTYSEEIKNEIESAGGKVFMSRKRHETGSDRIAEAAEALDFDVIVNVQGDEPFIKAEPLRKLVKLFDDPKTECASLMQEITSGEEIENPNNVKVVTDNENRALYFSRAPVPHDRDGTGKAKYFKHIGVYAFRKDILLRFTSLRQTPVEQSEKLEQLRMLQNGISIKMLVTDSIGVEIDMPEDINKAEEYLSRIEKK